MNLAESESRAQGREARPLALLRAAFHAPGTAVFRWTQGGVAVLIALSVVLLLAEVFVKPSPDAPTPAWLRLTDTIVLWLFAVEIALRVLTFRPKALDVFDLPLAARLRTHLLGRLRYCLRPLVLFDLVAVAALVPQLRGLRALRLLRLVRTQRFFRYTTPVEGIQRAFMDNRLLWMVAFSLFGASVLLGGVSIYLVELGQNENIRSLGDGIWWAIVTLTTVGFGDITPATGVGKVVGAALMVAGMFNLALFAGIVGNTLLNAVLSIREEQFRMSGIVDHLVICGWDPGSRMLLDALQQEVNVEQTPVVVFSEGERPADLPAVFLWVDGDPTKESELGKVRLTHAGAAIIVGRRNTTPQNADANTILTVFTVRRFLARQSDTPKRRRPLYVVAEILDAENVEHARTAGADEVIETTRLGFSLLAHSVTVPGSGAIMSRVAAAGAHSLFVGQAPEECPLPLPFGQLSRRLKEETGLLLLGVRDPATGRDQLNPPDHLRVQEGTPLLYLAEEACLPRSERAAPVEREG